MVQPQRRIVGRRAVWRDESAFACGSGADVTRGERAVRRLRELLGSGEYPVNGRLPPERELAEHLGLSRSALREGLALLEAEGLVWRHVGRGTFVGRRPLFEGGELSLVSDLTSPREVLEVRLELEPAITRFAALRATATHLNQMEFCLAKSRSVPDLGAWELWDSRLHRTIAEAAHNALLLAVFDAVNAVRTQTVWGRLQQLALSKEGQQTYWSHHRAVVTAIAERDASRAEQLMYEHIACVRDAMAGPAPAAAQR